MLPLTYDEEDSDGLVTLESSQSVSLISPEGFLGNGNNRALRVDSIDLPTWINGDRLGIQLDCGVEDYKSEEDVVLAIGDIWCTVREDTRNQLVPVAGITVDGTFTPLFRKDWVFQDTIEGVRDLVTEVTTYLVLTNNETGSTVTRYKKKL